MFLACKSLHKRSANEDMRKLLNVQLKSESANAKISECTNERTSNHANAHTSERENINTSKRVNECTSEYVNACMRITALSNLVVNSPHPPI